MIKVAGVVYKKEEIGAFDVDPINCFTDCCPDELPVPGGSEIVEELNGQAELAEIRVLVQDAHALGAEYEATPKEPQFTPVVGNENVNMRFNRHGVPGTPGFELIDGLDQKSYDFIAYKGVDPKMHPYGGCYHDLAEKISTGAAEFLVAKGARVVIVGGLATDYCVKLTVLQLLRTKYFDFIVLNLGACRGLDQQGVEKAIEEMRVAGAIIVNSCTELIG